MRYQDLQQSETISADAEESAHWEALANLLPCLERCFVEVDHAHIDKGVFSRLTVFSLAGRPYYIATSDIGQVLLGPVAEGQLAAYTTYMLGDFEPSRCEILSIAVTAGQRFVGNTLDLWITVRRPSMEAQSAKRRTYVYHAIVAATADGTVALRPARDDGEADEQSLWQPLPIAEHFPAWLQSWNFCVASEHAAAVPADVMAYLPQGRRVPLDAVVWQPPLLVYSLKGSLYLRRTDRPPNEALVVIPLGERASCLGLRRREQGYELLAGCDDRRLRGWRLCADLSVESGEEAFSQELDDFPVALIPLESSCGPVLQAGEYDLLAVFRSRTLKWLRYVDPLRLSDAWRRHWTYLVGDVDTTAFLVQAAAWLKQDEKRKDAILEEALRRCLEDTKAEPMILQDWLDALLPLCRPFRSERALPAAWMKRVIESVKAYLAGKRPSRPLPDGSDFVAALLFRLYTEECQLFDRSRVELALRQAISVESAVGDPALGQLRRWLGSDEQSEKEPDRQLWGICRTLDRWINLLWPVREFSLAPEKKICGFCVVEPQGQEKQANDRAVVVADADGIGVFWLSRTDGDSLGGADYQRLLQGQEILAIAALPEVDSAYSGVAVLLRQAQGIYLQILRVEEANTPTPSFVTGAALCVDEAEAAFSYVLCACRHSQGGSALALLANQGSQAQLMLWHVCGSAVGERLLSTSLSDVHWVSGADLAMAGDDYYLVTASDQHVTNSLYRVGAVGHSCKLQRSFDILKRGATAACFDSAQNPRYVACGGRSGSVWCAVLAGDGRPSDIRWCYRLQGPVRFIHAVLMDGRPCFLLGSDTGELCLLQADNGKRLWRMYMPGGMLYAGVFFLDGLPWVAVLQASNVLTIFQHLSEQKRQALWQEVEKNLVRFQPEPEEPLWQRAFTASYRAVYALEIQQQDVVAALPAIEVREAKLRLLRWAIEHPARLGGDTQALVEKLTPREWTLLLNFAGEQDEPYLMPILRALFQWLQQNEEPLRNSAKAAMATLLQHWRRRNPPLEEVMRHVPPAAFSREFDWVFHEFALLLLETLQRSLPRPVEPLLPYLIVPLILSPPRLLDHVYSLLAPRCREALDCLALIHWLDAAAHTEDTLQRDLQRLADCFQSVGALDDAQALLFSLIRLQACHWRHYPRDWQDWRHEAMEVLAALVLALRECGVLEGPLRGFAEDLKALLWLEEPAQDSDSRETRLDWLGKLRRKLDGAALEAQPRPAAPDWPALLRGLLVVTRNILRWQMEREYQHLLALVRPRLSLVSAQFGEGRRLSLRLQAEVDGDSRRLRDVTIEYRCGLLGPGSLEERRDYLEYPAALRQETLDFSGFAAEGADKLAVVAELQDGMGYRNSYVWLFALPAVESMDKTALPPPLRAVYDDFFQQLCRWRVPVGLVVVDAALGYGELLRDWDRAFPGRRLDLDAALREEGPGRRYHNQAVDGEWLWQPLAAFLAGGSPPSAADPPLLIGPLEETVERLLQSQAREVLVGWWQRLASSEKKLPPLRLLLGSRHAARLRGLAQAALPELALHRHLLENERPGLEAALLEWLAGGGELESSHAQRLWQSWGKDLRLLQRYQALAASGGIPLRNALWEEDADARDCLFREMQSLDSLELAALICGALASCQVPRQQAQPGLVAEQDYYSTSRFTLNRPKQLQARGEAFSLDSLRRLGADRTPPDQLRVQGVGLRDCVAESTGLLALLQGRSREWLALFSRLQQLGLGSYRCGVFRSHSPYRELIAGLYGQYPSANLQTRDAAAFAALAEAGRDPSELLRPSELAGAGRESLAALLPAASRSEQESLRTLALCWNGSQPLETAAPTLRKLFGDAGTAQAPLEHWSMALQDAGLPWLGLGTLELRHHRRGREQEAESYVFWLADSCAAAQAFDFPRFCLALERAIPQRTAWLQRHDYELDNQHPRFMLTGPGCECLAPDPQRRVALWRFADYARVAWYGGMADGLWRRARAQLNLSAFSLYRTAGALPSGSPLFVGRVAELAFIQQRLVQGSVLIVGCRRVGKTSLLNQVRHGLRLQGDADVLFLDLQGVADSEAFMGALRQHAEDASQDAAVRQALAKPAADVRQALYRLAEAVRRRGRRCVLLLNEIDALVQNAPALLEILRGLNDQGLMRFVLVGYAAIGSLGAPESPLFHFTEGMHFGGKAISLAELAPSAARQLLDLLEAPPLSLRWRSPADKEAAYGALLARSYRIPWVLQRYGQLLVEYLGLQQREELCLEDAKRVLHEHGNVVWNYIDNIEYASLGYGGPRGQGAGFKLLLYAVARHFYFFGGSKAPIRDSRLPQRRALELGFTKADVLAAAREAAAGLLRGAEQQAFLDWLDGLDLGQALRLLTLTLVLEPDPQEADRYAFLLHIFPLELNRLYGESDPRLDDLIIRTTLDFLRS